MSTSYSHVYGIDVSKDTLDICVLSQGRQRFVQITNDKPSILAWLAGLVKSQSYCVLEYTGTYSSQLIYLLSSHGVALSVVNPHQSSHFIKTLGVVNKNDKNAAQALALLGNSLDLPLYIMEPNSRQKRKQVLSSLSALKNSGRC